MLITNNFDKDKIFNLTEKMYVNSIREICWLLSDDSIDYGIAVESYWHALLLLLDKKIPIRKQIKINTSKSL